MTKVPKLSDLPEDDYRSDVRLNQLVPEGHEFTQKQIDHKRLVDQEAEKIFQKYPELPRVGEQRSWEIDGLEDGEVHGDPDHPEFKMLSMNAERGLKLLDQVEYLKQENPDVVVLQEVDWNCRRTDSTEVGIDDQHRPLNVADEMAKRAGYKYVTYVTEFVELDHDTDEEHLDLFPESNRVKMFKRGKLRAKGIFIKRGGGVHGRAILSKYPIDASSKKLNNYLFDWEDAEQGAGPAEPRQGQRVCQKAIVKIGNREVAIYNNHLENQYGTMGRMSQWDEIQEGDEKMIGAEHEERPCIIAGDFNTLSNGLAQVMPGVKKDIFNSLRRWFQSDASFWNEIEFSSAASKIRDRLNDGVFNPRQKHWMNPHGFTPTASTVKLKRKLDWALFEEGAFEIKNQKKGPKGLSDHDPLITRVELT